MENDIYAKARADLQAWRERQPTNFFTENRQLGRLTRRFLGEDGWARHRAHLERFGAVAAGPLDAAAIENNRAGNEPKLDRWSPIGERLEAIAHHPSFQACGRHIYEDGEVIAAYGGDAPHARALALFFLSSHAGEAGHNCPVACTAGIVKALAAEGSEELKARYMPGLLTNRFEERLDGAQFLTEIQGGSDVGANGTRAEPDGEALGTTRWRIHGEKWFCSNADADLILMTARWGGPGTSGLGLFLVPRLLEDGSVNAFTIRRLKEKLGTRSMASGEIDFHGAVAYAVGPVERGFKTVITQVIHTSRLYNTMATGANAQRAYFVAKAYAETREAFGKVIGDFPLVAEMIASLRGVTGAITAAGMTLARGLDRLEAGGLDEAEHAWLRVATNLAKMRSSQHSHRAVLTAIETLGGNGAIETFSVLPRLLRDNVVCENWEGTHNTLVAQTLRDFGRLRLHEGFLAVLRRDLLTGVASVDAATAPARAAVEHVADALHAVLAEKDPDVATFMLRPHAERLADAMFASAWAQDVAREEDAARRDAEAEALGWFVDQHVAATPPTRDGSQAARAARVAALPA
ncbi:MAG: acyl-CoA dehydrogenase family protein [Myxococcales bacterium]|nr:acyl-CoA dehydrogenase family protein [Myxococcales bacterium]MCB9736796.1 acyl-CoA dehydrogenase family protein [Deltaproteobacteria bacterium]